MDTRRLILYAALAFVLYSLWTAWQAQYPNPLVNTAQSDNITPTSLSAGEATSNPSNNPLLPDLDEQNTVEASAPVSGSTLSNESTDTLSVGDSTSANKLIHVKTDVLDIDIDTEQGDIVRAELLDYPVSADEKESPTILLTEQKSHR